MMWLCHKVRVLQIIKAPSHNLTRPSLDAFRPVCNRMILHFSYYGKYRVLVLVMTGQALLMSPKGRNASRDGLVKLWEGAFIICNTLTL